MSGGTFLLQWPPRSTLQMLMILAMVPSGADLTHGRKPRRPAFHRIAPPLVRETLPDRLRKSGPQPEMKRRRHAIIEPASRNPRRRVSRARCYVTFNTLSAKDVLAGGCRWVLLCQERPMRTPAGKIGAISRAPRPRPHIFPKFLSNPEFF
jgi:hypothetical protein